MSSVRRKSWDDMERKTIMLNMGGSCSVKNKRNMEFNAVKESIFLSLYRGIFKTLKNEVRLRSISIDIFIVMDKEKREVGAPL